MDLRTIKDASFQLLHHQSWKSLAQVSDAATILVQSFGELLNQAESDVHQWEKCPVLVHQRLIDNVCYSARNQFLLNRSVIFRVMLYSVPTYPTCIESMGTW